MNNMDVPAGTSSSSILTEIEYRRSFCNEFNPSSPSQQVLVNELARRATQMVAFDRAAQTVQSHVEQATVDLLDVHGNQSSRDVAAASAVANEKAAAIRHQGLRAAKGFMSTLHVLHRSQQAGMQAAYETLALLDSRFASEASCHFWLARRFVDGIQPCRRCGRRGAGSVIAARHCWECGGCKCQTGFRHGTVMQSSNLPLTVWFAAIRILLLRPTTSANQLSKLLPIPRKQTVRNLINRIREAVNADDASALLAGLDEVYLPIT